MVRSPSFWDWLASAIKNEVAPHFCPTSCPKAPASHEGRRPAEAKIALLHWKRQAEQQPDSHVSIAAWHPVIRERGRAVFGEERYIC